MRKGVIDHALDHEIQTVGGYSTTLNFSDRQKLRAIVRRVHLAQYPRHLVDDLFCDRVIDAIAPETAAYLIRHNLEGRNHG